MSSEDSPALPIHIGIIMDGNGRWAKKRGLSRTNGHKEGLEAAKRIVAHASDLGIKYLSLYCFSTENWRRSSEEVNFLLVLIKAHLRKQYDFYHKHHIRIMHSGNIQDLPEAVTKEIELAEQETANFDGMRVNLLINYGGRREIVRAVQRIGAIKGDLHNITEEDISSHLDHPEIPDLDLLIRTGGEVRLSNFLLWQSAYSEMYFSDIYWPQWSAENLDDALAYFQSRQRRFGGIVP